MSRKLQTPNFRETSSNKLQSSLRAQVLDIEV
jgi:hypothetical protein